MVFAAENTVRVFQLLVLLSAVRRRRGVVDVLECLRLYGARLPLGARGTAATLALSSVVPVHVAFSVNSKVAFFPDTVPVLGPTKTGYFFSAIFIQNLQWSVAFVLMLYPMVVVGSLSADLRRGCSQTMALRLRQPSSSLDKHPHEGVVMVVVSALVSPSLYMSHSLVEIRRGSTSKTALASALMGMVHLANLALLSSSCQWLFFESTSMKQLLQGFIVEAESLTSQETQEVSGFIKQIDQQRAISVWGMFEIDSKFTAAIILAASTHVAVLAQADVSFL
ncbi:Gustatory and pheromone receptor 32a [Frankliniella fusca]|uniref:Gustatory and pheromone receptor 32a n=1 Tax=Frankliniella fusca TaxID=407009 RepID=A0AAE1LD33_9NEOP|nr:Gustatory and pheromone receptor 32a [Frankliniella fusca]